ncbi:MAG: NGG1p interacting factor NIF3 [Elusimicrobiota bacterium]
MNLNDLYLAAVNQGIEKDPRGREFIELELAREKANYEKLSEEEKKSYDPERLKHPYRDTRILHTTGKEEIKSILIGVDIEAPELLLADNLRQKGRRIDAVVAHHPEGRAYAHFFEVMHMQAEIMNKFGVPINIAEGILDKRIKEVSRRVSPQNHNRAVDTARLLDVPYLCLHTPADNQVTTYLQSSFEAKKPRFLDDVVKILNEIPEYAKAMNETRGPQIVAGSKEKQAGRVFVDMTGGTEGSTEALEKLAYSGVGTIVGMHMSDEHLKNAEKFHINVVIAGHISSDNLGLNLLFDAVENKFGLLEYIPCSGFYRIRR